MRTIHYSILPGMGSGEISTSGTLIELLEAIPYLLRTRIPPRLVLKQILKQGLVDAGMSGGIRWEPFNLSEAEYAELADALEKKGLKRVNPPAWVYTAQRWSMWEMEQDRGVRARHLAHLAETCTNLQQQIAQAASNGDQEAAAALLSQYLDVAEQLVDGSS